MSTRCKTKIIIHMCIQVVFFIALIVVDRLTKSWAVSALKGKDPIPVIDNVLEMRYLENTGAAFGMLKNSHVFFYIVTVIVLAVVFYVWYRINSKLMKYCRFCEVCPDDFRKKTYRDMTLLNYMIALLSAGAVGNLIDRVLYHYVVDFVYFKIINFPIFNFADICVSISAIVLIIFFIFIYKEDPHFRIFNQKPESN